MKNSFNKKMVLSHYPEAKALTNSSTGHIEIYLHNSDKKPYITRKTLVDAWSATLNKLYKEGQIS